MNVTKLISISYLSRGFDCDAVAGKDEVGDFHRSLI
jgi:hypothetical protein